jgi:uncharacterized protein (TIGR03084 family)
VGELQQVVDLRAEADEFDRLLAGLEDSDWRRATLFKGWTVDDIVQHLHMGDRMALASAIDASVFAELRADIMAKRAGGLSRLEETRQRLNGLVGSRLRTHWRATLAELCDTLARKPLDARLPWAGPDMGVRMFTTARQMEIWAHAQAVYDVMGIERPAASLRLRNIAEIGVRTFGWTHRVRERAVPAIVPRVQLTAPDGTTWQWNAECRTDSVTGDAIAFCQVVTQTRNIADTTLVVEGPVATDWMRIAQCFAGPPETPPAKGTRHRAHRPT